MVALTSTQGIVLAGVGVALLVVGGALVVARGRRRIEAPDIPRAMRPGPSDPDLETPLLQKLQGWGVLLVLFFVVWIPATWIFEPSQNLDQDEEAFIMAMIKSWEESRAEGRQEGFREMLLRLLRLRFGSEVDADVEQRVATASVGQIEAWTVRLLSAPTLAELLAD